jgi:hypothetical protein
MNTIRAILFTLFYQLASGLVFHSANLSVLQFQMILSLSFHLTPWVMTALFLFPWLTILFHCNYLYRHSLFDPLIQHYCLPQPYVSTVFGLMRSAVLAPFGEELIYHSFAGCSVII